MPRVKTDKLFLRIMAIDRAADRWVRRSLDRYQYREGVDLLLKRYRKGEDYITDVYPHEGETLPYDLYNELKVDARQRAYFVKHVPYKEVTFT